MHNYLIMGGDKRQRILYEKLLCENKNIRFASHPEDFEDFAQYTDIILPLPLTRDGITVYTTETNSILNLKDIINKINKGQIVFGGGIPEKIKESLKYQGIKYFDYMSDEKFLTANAELTSQGALRLLLENTERYIVGSQILIVGFGRVARSLAFLLQCLGVKVCIAARSPEKATESGFDSIDIYSLSKQISRFDYIFGTVPCNVIDSEAISNIKDNSVYFELASAPFTAAKEVFIKQNKKHIDGCALPGKFLAEASAEIIAQFISSRSD